MKIEACPFCKCAVHQGAEVCHSCGAQKGYGRAGQSKHFSGWIGLIFAVFTLLGFAQNDPFLTLLTWPVGVFGAVLLARWAANLSSPPRWYRGQYREL
jgi:hypothetical protein